jgi:hypothetical protein
MKCCLNGINSLRDSEVNGIVLELITNFMNNCVSTIVHKGSRYAHKWGNNSSEPLGLFSFTCSEGIQQLLAILIVVQSPKFHARNPHHITHTWNVFINLNSLRQPGNLVTIYVNTRRDFL